MKHPMDKSQYGEDEILRKVFGDKRGGYVLDVGAADGILNSNSWRLLNVMGWGGLLIEPNDRYWMLLCNLYGNRNDVSLSARAIAGHSGKVALHIYGESCDHGQCSTIDDLFRKLVNKQHGDRYHSHVIVRCSTLMDVMCDRKCPDHIEFFSLDIEGMELVALNSVDWKKYSFDLICIEHSMDKTILDSTMKLYGYQLFTRTTGNSFYKPRIYD